jgi:hypothetical protein
MNNAKKKSIGSILAIHFAVLVAYCLIPPVVPFTKGTASWVIYGATIFSILLSAIISFVSFRSAKTLKSALYKLPIVQIALIYACLQIIASVVIYSLDATVGVPYLYSVVFSSVLFIFAISGVSVTRAQEASVETVEEETAKSTERHSAILDALNSAVASSKTEPTKMVASGLADLWSHSDPVSSEIVRPLEEEILDKAKSLNIIIENDDAESASELGGKIKALIEKRNDLLIRNK